MTDSFDDWEYYRDPDRDSDGWDPFNHYVVNRKTGASFDLGWCSYDQPSDISLRILHAMDWPKQYWNTASVAEAYARRLVTSKRTL